MNLLDQLTRVLGVYAWYWHLTGLYLFGMFLWNVRKAWRLMRQVDWGYWWDDLRHGRLYPKEK